MLDSLGGRRFGDESWSSLGVAEIHPSVPVCIVPGGGVLGMGVAYCTDMVPVADNTGDCYRSRTRPTPSRMVYGATPRAWLEIL